MESLTERASLNLKEAARYIGVSEMTVRRLVMRQELARVKIGRRVLFLKPELDRCLQAHVRTA
jgi:excisionase family DNA binding protein